MRPCAKQCKATSIGTPFNYLKAGDSAFVRELTVPFESAACVALFEIDGAHIVTILAVRHQLEDDYH